jgi:hypothetical protein
MKSLAKVARTNKALLVINRMGEGLSISAACKETGIPRSTFYDLCKRDPQGVAAIQEMMTAEARQRLVLILVNQTRMLELMIQDGLAETTKPRDRIRILRELDKLQDKLQQMLRLNQGDDTLALEILGGPVLKPGKSRLTGVSSTVIDVENGSMS